MNNIEIFVTYTSYKNDEGKDYRTEKRFGGLVKDLLIELKDISLSNFEIHFWPNPNSNQLILLGERLQNCANISKPYIYAGSMY